MRLYLDMCSLQRPWDDKTQMRVRVEAEAVLSILAFCEAGGADMVSSDALEYETDRNPHPARKAYALDVLAKAAVVIRVTDAIRAQAHSLTAAGLTPLDALHLACAANGGVHYFCTCDDRLRSRARLVHTPPPVILRPLELVTELGL